MIRQKSLKMNCIKLKLNKEKPFERCCSKEVPHRKRQIIKKLFKKDNMVFIKKLWKYLPVTS